MEKSGSRSRSRKAKSEGDSSKSRTGRAAAAATTNGAVAETGATVAPEERRRLIAEAAYYRAVRRQFADGDELSDWLEAEAEVAVRLDGSHQAPAEAEPPRA
jgi:DUF2934 family protein